MPTACVRPIHRITPNSRREPQLRSGTSTAKFRAPRAAQSGAHRRRKALPCAPRGSQGLPGAPRRRQGSLELLAGLSTAKIWPGKPRTLVRNLNCKVLDTQLRPEPQLQSSGSSTAKFRAPRAAQSGARKRRKALPSAPRGPQAHPSASGAPGAPQGLPSAPGPGAFKHRQALPSASSAAPLPCAPGSKVHI